MPIFRNRAYEELLEAECRRLRHENRQLLNAILAKAGMPSMAAEEGTEAGAPVRRRNWRQIGHLMTRKTREAVEVARVKMRNEGGRNGQLPP